MSDRARLIALSLLIALAVAFAVHADAAIDVDATPALADVDDPSAVPNDDEGDDGNDGEPQTQPQTQPILERVTEPVRLAYAPRPGDFWDYSFTSSVLATLDIPATGEHIAIECRGGATVRIDVRDVTGTRAELDFSLRALSGSLDDGEHVTEFAINAEGMQSSLDGESQPNLDWLDDYWDMRSDRFTNAPQSLLKTVASAALDLARSTVSAQENENGTSDDDDNTPARLAVTGRLADQRTVAPNPDAPATVDTAAANDIGGKTLAWLANPLRLVPSALIPLPADAVDVHFLRTRGAGETASMLIDHARPARWTQAIEIPHPLDTERTVVATMTCTVADRETLDLQTGAPHEIVHVSFTIELPEGALPPGTDRLEIEGLYRFDTTAGRMQQVDYHTTITRTITPPEGGAPVTYNATTHQTARLTTQ